ncbi:coproporphyrinogen III oxidase [Rhizobium sp. Leaf384]|uniref:oxygen-independent coproporphyrinogen III oxidase n=1 Tax=unclassified Rhizobium TaxID=2613769 RepID=UPI000715A1D0|nr:MULTISPECIES: oxygen-independent coproporphyrinogen III oxidase [unclassified Rhizobium]KQS77151.1 coproporphyrinogen III oxidase [Rhizobium sp. Leaf384]KQS78423.1 coproporphyrinogen III oxidase [Rhizobium sp. Leaf383]
MNAALIEKYGNARLPRYTSYPTAPLFSDTVGARQAADWLRDLAPEETSLYIHIPYCRAMCWYCGCHTTVSHRDEPIRNYLRLLQQEIAIVTRLKHGARSDERIAIAELHFGGGTPTVVAPQDFVGLMETVRSAFDLQPECSVSVEIDPRTMTAEMADALAASGVNRASLGVQSFDPIVQRAINRIQPPELTALTADRLRARGITALNVDLIYGLPLQTVRSCIETAEEAMAMRPEQVSVFGYAHVPSFKKHQRLIRDKDLPDAWERGEQAQAIAQTLISAGYEAVGLDHFALPDAPIAVAARTGRLHRNFQGYTTDACRNMIGLGASSISRFVQGYVQNEVPIGAYARRISQGELATTRGYALTEEDRMRAEIIERLMCDFDVDLERIALEHGFDPQGLVRGNARLRALEADGVLAIDGARLRVAKDTRFMVRAVAAAFDAYLQVPAATYSKTA